MCKCSFWINKNPIEFCGKEATHGIVIEIPLLDEEVIREMSFPFIRICPQHFELLKDKITEHLKQGRIYKKVIAQICLADGHIPDFSELKGAITPFEEMEKRFPGCLQQIQELEAKRDQVATELSKQLH